MIFQRKLIGFAYLFFCSLFFVSCAHKLPKSELVMLPTDTPKPMEYRFADEQEQKLIAPGDLISVSYIHDAKLNGHFRVAFDGSITLPYKVKELVAGLTSNQFSKLIRSKYVGLYNNVDEIEISVVERKRWLQITGDASPVGNRLVDVDANITQILSQNNSKSTVETDERKKLKFLKIKWKDFSLVIDLKKYFNNSIDWKNRIWHGGEVLSFQSNIAPDDVEFPMVRVMGDVVDPGSYKIEQGLDFYSYILKSGGVKSTANIENIQLIRGGQYQRKVYTFNLEDLSEIGNPQANDTVIVFQDRQTSIEKRLQIVATIASILSALTIFGMAF